LPFPDLLSFYLTNTIITNKLSHSSILI